MPPCDEHMKAGKHRLYTRFTWGGGVMDKLGLVNYFDKGLPL